MQSERDGTPSSAPPKISRISQPNKPNSRHPVLTANQPAVYNMDNLTLLSVQQQRHMTVEEIIPHLLNREQVIIHKSVIGNGIHLFF